MVILFWTSFLFFLYTYGGYPLCLYILTKLRSKEVHKDVDFELPFVSVVIAARNEGNNIRRRLDNLLAQEYPPNRLEIIVVSDGSTDETHDEVLTCGDSRVRLSVLPTPGGKALAVNNGVDIAKGEIIVFTDARQEFNVDALVRLVENFADPGVGCVSGELCFWKSPFSKIEAEIGAYWKYEKWIRKMESTTGSVVGATGAIYAVRKALYRHLPQGTLLDDVLTPLTIAMSGYRSIFDGASVAHDVVSKDVSQEWRRKVRTLAGNWQLLGMRPQLALPWTNSLWWRFLSHKIFRVVLPFSFIPLFISGCLIPGPFYKLMTMLQILVYGCAFLGAYLPEFRKVRFINLSCFFVAMNAAAVAGFWVWLSGGCASAWHRDSKLPSVP